MSRQSKPLADDELDNSDDDPSEDDQLESPAWSEGEMRPKKKLFKTAKELYLEEEINLIAKYQYIQEYFVRKKIALRNLQEEISVNSTMNFIVYNTPLQIIYKDINNVQKQYALTTYMHIKDLQKNKVYFNTNMPLFISPKLEPMCCNVFILERVYKLGNDDFPVHYGAIVRIKVTKKSGDKNVPLYLTVNSDMGHCHDNLILLDEPTNLSSFQLLYPFKEQQTDDIIEISKIVHIKNIQTGYYLIGQTTYDMYNICGEGKAVSCTCIYDDERSLEWTLFAGQTEQNSADKMIYSEKISSKNDLASVSDYSIPFEICKDPSHLDETSDDFLPRPPPSRSSPTRPDSKKYFQSLEIIETEAIPAADLPARPPSQQIDNRGESSTPKIVVSNFQKRSISKEGGDFVDQTLQEHGASLIGTAIRPDKITSNDDSTSAVYSLMKRYKHFSIGDKFKMMPSPPLSPQSITEMQKKDVTTESSQKSACKEDSIKETNLNKPDENVPFLEKEETKSKGDHMDKNTLKFSNSFGAIKKESKFVAHDDSKGLTCVVDGSKTFESVNNSNVEERPPKKLEKTQLDENLRNNTDVEEAIKLFLKELPFNYASTEECESKTVTEQEIISFLEQLRLESLQATTNEGETSEPASESKEIQISSPLVTQRSEADESYTTATTIFDTAFISCSHSSSDSEEEVKE